jgi:ferrochelatase
MDVEEIRAYYTHIRKGRPPSEQALHELVHRYRRIGGSPFMDITERQVQVLRNILHRERPDVRVYQAMKHVPPFIPDVAEEIVQDGIQRVVALVLAPHESRMIVDDYLRYAEERFQRAGVDLHPIRTWHLNPGYLNALEQRIRQAMEGVSTSPFVLFTAHSLPRKILNWKDPYPQRLQETAQALARRIGLSDWRVVYQSAGHTREPWLGPDLLDSLDLLAEKGVRSVLVVPIGFVSDHLEILWDLDVEARTHARSLGLQLIRIPSLNDDMVFLEGLAEEVMRHLP